MAHPQGSIASSSLSGSGGEIDLIDRLDDDSGGDDNRIGRRLLATTDGSDLVSRTRNLGAALAAGRIDRSGPSSSETSSPPLLIAPAGVLRRFRCLLGGASWLCH